jgi:hypothetical protein
LDTHNQSAANRLRIIEDARRKPRFKIIVDIKIISKTCGVLKGHTVDLSESGLAAMLTIEVPVGEIVELEFTLPFGKVLLYAVVRQRNAFRYGFQFIDPSVARKALHATCRHLEVEQALLGEL